MSEWPEPNSQSELMSEGAAQQRRAHETAAAAQDATQAGPQVASVAGRRRVTKWAAWLALLLLAASVAWPLWHRAHSRATEPDDASLGRAAAHIGQHLQAGDALLFYPGWGAHQGWRFATQWQARGLDFRGVLQPGEVPGEGPDPWLVDGFARAWVVTTHGYLPKLHMPLRKVSVRDTGHGTAVTLYEVPTTTTIMDFRRQLDQGTVQIATPEPWRDCPWRGAPHRGRFACGGPEFQDVWQDIQEVGNTRRDCIYFHPPSDRGTVRLRFDRLPAYSGPAELRGFVGNRLWAVRHNLEGAPTQFRVRVGDRIRWQVTLPTGDFGYHRWHIPLSAAEAGQPVTFEASTEREAWRELCFDARLQVKSQP